MIIINGKRGARTTTERKDIDFIVKIGLLKQRQKFIEDLRCLDDFKVIPEGFIRDLIQKWEDEKG